MTILSLLSQMGEVPMLTEAECVRLLRVDSAVFRDDRGYVVHIEGVEDARRADELCGLAARLPELHKLTLQSCAVTAEGVRALTAVKNLEELWLRNQHPPNEAYKYLPEFKSLRRLQCSASITNDGLKSIGKLRGLVELELLGASSVTEKGLPHLVELHNLTSLGLGKTAVNNDLSPLKKLRKLRQLELEWSNVDDATLKTLAGMESLETLYVGYSKVTDACIPTLRTFPKLTGLSIRSNQITKIGIRQLCESGQPLVTLFMDEISVDDETVLALGTMKSLKTLCVLKVGISRRQLERLQLLLPKCDIQSDLTSDD